MPVKGKEKETILKQLDIMIQWPNCEAQDVLVARGILANIESLTKERQQNDWEIDVWAFATTILEDRGVIHPDFKWRHDEAVRLRKDGA